MFVNEIRTIFTNELGLDISNLNDNDNIFEKGIMDSLTTLRLMVRLEEKFLLKIDLSEIEIDDFSTINKINEYISKNVK